MTKKKRFTCDNDYYKGLILKDNLTNEILEEDGIGGYDNACDKLNELAEENEQLKKRLSHLEYRFTEYRMKVGDRE